MLFKINFMKKKFSLMCFCLGLTSIVSAQDPHYSQYFMAPLSVNPSFTGFMDGSARAMVNYRSQWSTINNAFNTVSGSFDGVILGKHLPKGDRLGVGLMFMNDQIAGGTMSNTYVSASIAYHKSFDQDGKYTLGVGLQGSYAQRSINGSKLIFDDQLDRFGVFSNPSSDAAAGVSGLRRNYLDMSVGAVFKARFNERNQFYFGASMYHLAGPKITFMDDAILKMPIRMTFNGVFESKLSDMLSISLLGMYSSHESASEGVFGAIAMLGKSEIETFETPIFYLGMLYRTKDAVIPYVGIERWDMRLGLSYDYNTSSLSAVSKGQGGFEISMVYLLRIPPNKQMIYLCPDNPKF
jgi:type IX secretion system PorP/SprF family membrane protein